MEKQVFPRVIEGTDVGAYLLITFDGDSMAVSYTHLDVYKRQGQTFSKEQIYEAVFGFDAPGDQAAVTEHIKNIRAKLRALDCHPIDTVWGVGYRWKRDLP